MNAFRDLADEQILKVVLEETSYRKILQSLNCHTNSGNINLLKQFMKKYNLKLCIKPEKQEKAYCSCQYCGKKYTTLGINYHEKYCKENPNKEINLGNKGKTKGYAIWNKGQSIKTNNSVKQQSITLTKKYLNKEIVPPHLGKKLSEVEKQKIREGMIRYIEKYKGPMQQHFNINSGKYIENLNASKNWNLQYYANGGEIKVIGYFLDGYDKDKNIAFEYDEPKHYKDVYNNILTDKDLQRQQNIINELNCEFWRYNERLDLLYRVN